MARLKFLLFAIPVLGLWIFQLFLLSPALTARAVELGASHARSIPYAVEARVLARRAELQQIALRIAEAPAARTGAPSERLAAATSIVSPSGSEEFKRGLIVGVVTDSTSTFQRAGEELKADGLDASLAKAGAEGMTPDVAGVAHLFFSVPGPGGSIVVGAPFVSEGALAQIVKETGASAIALFKGGQRASAAGADSGTADIAAKELKAGKTAVVGRGPVSELFGIELPVLTSPEGAAPRFVGARQILEGTPYEVVAVASLQPYLEALASFQKVALLALLGLIGLAALGTVLVGGSPPIAESSDEDLDTQRSLMPLYQPAPLASYNPAPAIAPQAPIPLIDSPASPETTPDDFPFGPSRRATPPPEPAFSQSLYSAPLAPEPVATPEPIVAEPLRPAFDHEETRAYPIQTGNDRPAPFNPEQTRVAPIPEELLRQSASAAPAPRPARTWMEPPPPPPPVATSPMANPAPASPEEMHFQDVYREFVATRERCGEGADGLTYDRFVVKLRKNRETLIQKYNCKTVRFQVYVKEGKAALKATPVKD